MFGGINAFAIALGKGFHLEPVKLPPSPRRMLGGQRGRGAAQCGAGSAPRRGRGAAWCVQMIPSPAQPSGWGNKKLFFSPLLAGARQSFLVKKSSKRAARRSRGCCLAPVSWGVGNPLLPGLGLGSPGEVTTENSPSTSPQRRVALSRGRSSIVASFPAFLDLYLI